MSSWRRSRQVGVTPDNLVVPYFQDLDFEGALLRSAQPVLDRLAAGLSGMHMCILLTDERARILARRVGEPSLRKHLDRFQLSPGFGYPEDMVGTNGIGTALTTRRPAYVHGPAHFADSLGGLACAGAPIHHPFSGQLLGVLDLTSRQRHADPVMLQLAREAAHDIERRLLDQEHGRERALIGAFLQSGNYLGTAASLAANDSLSQWDRLALEEKAVELISAGSGAITEVPLSRGRSAVLLAREVTSPSGEAGVAVEAVLPPHQGRWQVPVGQITPPPDIQPAFTMPTSTTLSGSAAPSPPAAAPHPATAPALTDASLPVSVTRGATFLSPPEEQTPVADGRWLVAIGEPGMGRIALQARRRLALLAEAGAAIGTTLDITRTAEELTEVAVPVLAEYVAVDLPDSVIRGEEPVRMEEGLRRIAFTGIHPDSLLVEVGDIFPYVPASPQARCLAADEPVLEPDLASSGWLAQDSERGKEIIRLGIRSVIAVPLRARGAVLGVVSFYRERPEPFAEDDLSLAEELVSRAAVCVDNARRYTREHLMALALQQALLPQGLPEQSAVEAAYRYLPAHTGVGGDWYDVIPLSGARVALVVGDVMGHGVHAAATMGQLRTAVHNYSALDLPPEDLLTNLDELVGRLGVEDCVATCLYGVYDPVSRCCTFARAGHPPPALVLPGGTVEFPNVPAGPPLGLGGTPFETVEVAVPEGSRLALYTDGLIELRQRDIDTGIDLLRHALAGNSGRSPEEMCAAVMEAMLDGRPQEDDVALLVVRMKGLDADRWTDWEMPDDRAAVSGVREKAVGQLEEWGLMEQAFSTELIVSELVTNAIRHAGAPISLRLLRDDHALICEVSDGSSTYPRLRRAGATDEGGRGLFMVSQLAQRWGTRYTPNGKIIWTEQRLAP
jgi:serine phosphatase RsbU (regulator of sigma subunit)/anti-sigma regulatory factor (Ser/Thr protein kinase)